MGTEGEKCSKTFFKVLERQNMLNETISELYQDILAILRTFSKLQKSLVKNFPPWIQLPKLPLLSFLSNEQFTLCEAKMSLDEIIKSTNSQTNNKSCGKYGHTTEFYIHFSN